MTGTATKRATAAIAAVLGTLLVMVGMATSAWPTDNPPLEFSSDGQRWSPRAPVLFPGEQASSVLWVRHHGPSAAHLGVVLVDDAADPAGVALREWLTVTINEQTIPQGEAWQGPPVEPGDSAEIYIAVTLDPEAPESMRRQSADVLSLITFGQVPASQAAGLNEHDRLATSGATVMPVLLLAGALIILGAALKRKGRRHRVGAPPRPGR